VALVNDIAGVARAEMKILAAAGYPVDFYELPLIGASWPALARLIALPVRLACYLPVIYKLRRGNYKLLHIHFVSQGIVGLAVGKPFFLHAHGSDLHANLKSAFKRRLSLLIMRRARGIFYTTPNLRQYLDGFTHKSHLLGNPIDTSLFNPGTTPSGLSDLLVFTRLEPIKGVDRIFERAAEMSTLIKMTAVGWGPLTHEYSERYGSMVRFIHPVPHAEIPRLLQRFSVVIGQMRQGVLGLSELEAMAAGRPVLANVDLRFYGDDPPPVVDAKDGDGLINALRRLKSHPEEVQELSRAGRAWVERHHSPQRHLEVLSREYSKIG
jgi:glycosyltransferase involved in cell wall biosynthesis